MNWAPMSRWNVSCSRVVTGSGFVLKKKKYFTPTIYVRIMYFLSMNFVSYILYNINDCKMKITLYNFNRLAKKVCE